MKQCYLIVALAVALTELAKGETDEEIKQTLVLANCFVDNAYAADRMFNRAVDMCGSDSNRLARLFYEISLTNDALHASSAVMRLGQYGTSAQLPYLYSVVTNEIRGAEAAKAILQIEGVTTNSILAVSNCLARMEIDEHERHEAFYDFVERVYGIIQDGSNRNFGLGYINWYVRNENMNCRRIDKLLIKVDSSYRQSKRRLADLRSAINRGVHEFQVGYITNAINELVAYPEANLPE